MCKNNSWKIRTYGKGVVLEIQTHPDREKSGLKIRDLADVLCRRPQDTLSTRAWPSARAKVSCIQAILLASVLVVGSSHDSPICIAILEITCCIMFYNNTSTQLFVNFTVKVYMW